MEVRECSSTDVFQVIADLPPDRLQEVLAVLRRDDVRSDSIEPVSRFLSFPEPNAIMAGAVEDAVLQEAQTLLTAWRGAPVEQESEGPVADVHAQDNSHDVTTVRSDDDTQNAASSILSSSELGTGSSWVGNADIAAGPSNVVQSVPATSVIEAASLLLKSSPALLLEAISQLGRRNVPERQLLLPILEEALLQQRGA